MGSESTGIDELDQYRNISKKLKKTFFKKPNESEALESYVSLAREWENSELPAYAGLSWHAAAKCENSLGNPVAEVTNLIRSARQYATAEEKNVRMGCISIGDNMQAALTSYNMALSKYEKGSTLAVTLNLEVVGFLRRIDRLEYVENYLRDALENCSERGFMKVECLSLLATILIERKDYLSALDTFTEIYNIVETLPDSGANAEIHLKCEISRVLLLLILKPPPQKLTPELTKILERYTWGDRNDEALKRCKMKEIVFILLESLVTTCQSADTSSLIDLQGQLWTYLSSEQKNLLCILVKLYCP